jgi:hypothetical protein
MMILDGASIAPGIDPQAYLLACYPEASIPPISHVVMTAPPLVARVNHGRWIASCSCGARGLPTPGCIVFLGVLLGWCVRCNNGAWGGGWRMVQAPQLETRVQIEAVLEQRPRIEDRNWEPGETVADLIRENREHGDPVPDLAAFAGPELGPDWRERAAPFSPLPRAVGRLRRMAGRWIRGR